MFTVYLTNFGYWLKNKQEYPTYKDAIEAAKQGGFDSTIYEDGVMVGSWSIIGGTRGRRVEA